MAKTEKLLVIFGAWYFADVIEELAIELGWRVFGRIDPDPPDHVQVLQKMPKNCTCFVAIGDNYQRQYVYQQLHNNSRNIISLIHPSSSISKSAKINEGSYIGENVSVRTGSTLGCGVIVNAGAVISHHCSVGDFVLFGPNSTIGSKSAIDSCSIIGAGASIRPSCTIGKNCTVGAGAAVLSQIPDSITVIGNPAKKLRITSKKPGSKNRGKQSDWASHKFW